MAQLTSTTPSVTATNGLIWENLPLNPENVIRAYKIDDFKLNSGDLNNYPAIVFDLVNNTSQYWAYALGDIAGRDADFALVNVSVSPNSIDDISASVRQDSSNWTTNGQTVFNARFTLAYFGEEDFDECGMHDATVNASGTATGVHALTTLQDTSQSWTVNEWAGQAVKITGGTSAGEVHRIVSNTADTLTIVTGWVVQVDNTSTYEVSNATKVVIPSDGKYLLPGRFTYSANAAGIRGIAIYKNNVFLDNFFANPVGVVESQTKNQCFAYDLLKDDVIEFYAYQSSGFSLDLLSFGLRNRFQAIAQRGVVK